MKITHSSVNPGTPVAVAMIIVNIIENMYTRDGTILCFFFIAFTWPLGVDRKQLPLIFNIWQNENTSA